MSNRQEQEMQEQMAPAVYETRTAALALDPASINSMMSLAEKMASSKVTVPDHLRNSADCLAVVMQAAQWGMNPFAVAQKTHLVSGRLGYEAQLVNAVVMASGAIRGRFHYEYRGDGEQMECRVGAVPRGESEIVWGEWLMLKNVATRNSPLWKTNQKQQLGYLQVKNWCRLYAPGAILGVYTPDELEPDGVRPSPRIVPRATDILPEYPADSFEKNLPSYRRAIESGKKTADQIISTIGSKYTVTQEQQDALREIAVPPPPAQTESTEQGEPQA